MPDIFDNIPCIWALVMQLLDYHPYSCDHLVPTNRLCLPCIVLGLYPLANHLPTTGHIGSCQYLEGCLANRIAKEGEPQRVLAKDADNFATCPASSMTFWSGRKVLGLLRLLRLLGLLRC